MKHTRRPHLHSLLLACCMAAACPAAHAEETATTTTTTTTTSASTSTTAVGTSSTTEAKLSAEFAGFLGGDQQASAVVSGLRQGTAFTLDAASTGTATGTGTTATTTTSTTINPPTGTMGYGNVRITLRLAQAELNQMGITQPTSEQLSAVLIGGEINGTQVNGILTMRADGMGWGQIAQKYGMTVGQIMGKGNGLTKQTATTQTSQMKHTGKVAGVSGSTTQSAQTSQARANGYIPDSPTYTSHAHSNGYIPSGKSGDAGIVTASGSSLAGSASGTGTGQAHKAGGQQISMAGASNAGGNASATAPGQARKN